MSRQRFRLANGVTFAHDHQVLIDRRAAAIDDRHQLVLDAQMLVGDDVTIRPGVLATASVVTAVQVMVINGFHAVAAAATVAAMWVAKVANCPAFVVVLNGIGDANAVGIAAVTIAEIVFAEYDVMLLLFGLVLELLEFLDLVWLMVCLMV